MSALATACPGCGTVFRVGPAQLDAADGLVRCGACDTVFDAPRHAVGQVAPALEPSARSIDEEYITGLIRGEPPEKPAPEAGSADTTLPEPAVAATPAPQPAVPDDAIAPPQTEAAADSPRPVSTTPADAMPRIAVELPRGRVRNAVRRRVLAWSGAILTAAMLVALQQIWIGRERHAQDPALRPRYEWLCAHLGCELPPFRDLRRIRSESLLVRPDPARPGTLLIDATIVNRAAFAQAFPVIRIDFSDMQGKPVQSRAFLPSQYLGAAALREGRMPPGEVLQLHVEMPDPGENATNYELRLAEPEAR